MVENKTVLVWDIAVRVFHWLLVVAFFTAYLSGEDQETLHAYSGYTVLGLVLFRIVWGFVGGKYARFSNFVYGPKATIQYLQGLLRGRPRRYLGHNPAGGWMVILLLASILLATWSGLVVYGLEGKGPLAAAPTAFIAAAQANDREHEAGESEAEEYWEEVHEFTSNLALFLVIWHILGVLLSSLLHRENLIKAMITGRKSGGPTAGDK